MQTCKRGAHRLFTGVSAIAHATSPAQSWMGSAGRSPARPCALSSSFACQAAKPPCKRAAAFASISRLPCRSSLHDWWSGRISCGGAAGGTSSVAGGLALALALVRLRGGQGRSAARVADAITSLPIFMYASMFMQDSWSRSVERSRERESSSASLIRVHTAASRCVDELLSASISLSVSLCNPSGSLCEASDTRRWLNSCCSWRPLKALVETSVACIDRPPSTAGPFAAPFVQMCPRLSWPHWPHLFFARPCSVSQRPRSMRK